MKQEPTEDLWEKAKALHLADRFQEAEAAYVALLEQNHDNAGLMATLGSLYLQVGRKGLAIHFLECALKAGLKEPDMFTNLGIAYKAANQQKKARENFELSIKENPSAEALTNYSAMFIECGESKKCAELCERAIAMKSDMAMAHWNLAISLLGDGVWGRAWDEQEWGFKSVNMREDRDIAGVPWWDGTPGQTVLIYGEQGLGDEIMFASMLPDILKTNKVVLECHSRLETLFKKSFPDVAVYGTREEQQVPAWVANHKIDARLCIGSLGKFYRRSHESFPGTPYLKAEPLPKGEKFRVGISWKGGGAKWGRVQKRSIPLAWWKPLLSIPNVEFVSLQYTDESEDMDMMDALGFPIKRMDEARSQDYYDTARLVASCDLVISVCTSVIHLAGALGVPCWVLVPKYPAWRYQNKGPMPWYKSVRLYRSPDADQLAWHAVISRVVEDLEDKVGVRQRLQAVA